MKRARTTAAPHTNNSFREENPMTRISLYSRRAAALRMTQAIALVFGGSVAAGSQAFDYEYQGVHAQIDSQVSTSAAIRTQSPDPILIGIANGGKAYSVNADDGDLAYAKGDLVSQVNTIESNLTLTYKDFGLFTRGYYLYDSAVQNHTLFDRADFGPGKQYGYDVYDQKVKDVRDHDGHSGRILDLYGYGNVDLFDHGFSFKVGRQTINWGESTLILNGLNSILAFDANRANGPGVELSQIIQPSNNVFVSTNLIDSVSAEGWYQLKWEQSIPNASGTYFGTNDYIGIGGNAGNIDFGRAGENAPVGPYTPYGGTVPRGDNGHASNSGQFGGAVHWSTPYLNNMEVALYAANYHSRLPLYSTISADSGNVNAQTARYFSEFPEDIHMYGLSFNTTLPLGFALQGEYSYKPNQPLQIDDVELDLATLGAHGQLNPGPTGATLGNQYIRGYRRHGVNEWDMSTTRIFAPSNWFGYNQFLFLAEAAVIYVPGLEDQSVLRYEGPGTFLPGDAATAASLGLPQQNGGYATQTSWGYKLIGRATYNNVLPNVINGLTLEPTLRFDDDVYGVTPTPLGNFVEGSRLATISLGVKYLSATSGEIGWTTFFGGGQANLVRDRDYAFVNLKYAF
jgi:hypothetical protein